MSVLKRCVFKENREIIPKISDLWQLGKSGTYREMQVKSDWTEVKKEQEETN